MPVFSLLIILQLSIAFFLLRNHQVSTHERLGKYRSCKYKAWNKQCLEGYHMIHQMGWPY